MGYENSGPRVGLEVAARPVSGSAPIQVKSNDAEIDSFVRGLGALGTGLDAYLADAADKDKKAGMSAGLNNAEKPENASKAFHQGYFGGAGQAAAIMDTAEIKAKIRTEAPDNPQLAKQMWDDYRKSKIQGTTVREYEEGYNSIFDREGMQIISQVTEENSRRAIAENDTNASIRVADVIQQLPKGMSYADVHAALAQIAADHSLTPKRKDELTFLALRQLAGEGHPGVLQFLDSPRVDSKTGGAFPALSANPNYAGESESIRSTTKRINNERQAKQFDDRMLEFGLKADAGKLDPVEVITWAEQFPDLNKSGAVLSLIRANEAALAAQDRETARLLAMQANKDAIQGLNSRAAAAVAGGTGTFDIKDAEIPNTAGTGTTKYTAQDQIEAGWKGWVAATKPDPETRMRQATRLILPSGKTYDDKELTDQLRQLSTADLRSAVYVNDKDGQGSTLNPDAQISPEAKTRIQLFRSLNTNYSPYLREQLGEKIYENLELLTTLMDNGVSDVEAAALAHNAQLTTLPPLDEKRRAAAEKAIVSDFTRTHLLSFLPYMKDDANVSAIQGTLRKLTYALLKTGTVADPQEAANKAGTYLKNQMFTTGGGVYFQKDFPKVPEMFKDDPGAAVKVVIEDAVRRSADKTLSASDLYLYKLPDGRWQPKRVDGQAMSFSAPYNNADIARVWSSMDKADLDRRIAEKSKQKAAAPSKPLGSQSRSQMAKEQADRAALNN